MVAKKIFYQVCLASTCSRIKKVFTSKGDITYMSNITLNWATGHFGRLDHHQTDEKRDENIKLKLIPIHHQGNGRSAHFLWTF